jgi:hypothetical protein
MALNTKEVTRYLGRSVAFLTTRAGRVRSTNRYSQLFALSDDQLHARGLDRQGLMQAFIKGV